MKFSVGIVNRERNPHAACFEDFAVALAGALRACGHETVPFGEGGRLIMLGANNMHDVAGTLPEDAIVFNTEQAGAVADPRAIMWAHEQWARHVVWDYSRANLRALRGIGLEKTVHCPIWYEPSMERGWTPIPEDVDVLFYGSVNARRREILDAVHKSGLKLKVLFGVYGEERDAWIRRSKVVLNIHFYERPVFEIFRVSHILANKKCVVSEDGGCDPELEDFARRATVYRSREDIVRACRELVADAELRADTEENGHAVFRETSLAESVVGAVEATVNYDGRMT